MTKRITFQFRTPELPEEVFATSGDSRALSFSKIFTLPAGVTIYLNLVCRQQNLKSCFQEKSKGEDDLQIVFSSIEKKK